MSGRPRLGAYLLLARALVRSNDAARGGKGTCRSIRRSASSTWSRTSSRQETRIVPAPGWFRNSSPSTTRTTTARRERGRARQVPEGRGRQGKGGVVALHRRRPRRVPEPSDERGRLPRRHEGGEPVEHRHRDLHAPGDGRGARLPACRPPGRRDGPAARNRRAGRRRAAQSLVGQALPPRPQGQAERLEGFPQDGGRLCGRSPRRDLARHRRGARSPRGRTRLRRSRGRGRVRRDRTGCGSAPVRAPISRSNPAFLSGPGSSSSRVPASGRWSTWTAAEAEATASCIPPS